MTTAAELAERVLRKLKVLGAVETASPEDLNVAMQAVTDAHNTLDGHRLLRWTLQDIPKQVDLGYVLMAAYLCADDFVVPKDPGWMVQGMGVVQTFVNIPADCGPTYVEDF